MKKIILTGGGTAGHVTPNIALIPKLKEHGWEIEYIGSVDGIEKQLINTIDIPYHSIASGKLRRYFSLQNFTDPLKVLKGIFQAISIIKKIKPKIIFSKGGFVTVPIVIAGYLNKVPVIIHESDITPGLANKLSATFAKKICTSFSETLKYLPSEKAIHTGTPIRKELIEGDSNKGFEFTGLKGNKSVLLVIGGSLGSEKINKAIREIADKLLYDFDIVQICGKGNVDHNFNKEGYKQFEYISSGLPDVFAIADIVVSRAGSNAIFDLLALKKPNLLIPLSKKSSRGDQILNAESFEKAGFSKVLYEDDLTAETLFNSIHKLNMEKDKYINKMEENRDKESIDEIINLIEKCAL